MLGRKVHSLYYKRCLSPLFRLRSAKRELGQQNVPPRDLEACRDNAEQASRASIERTSYINYYVYRAS